MKKTLLKSTAALIVAIVSLMLVSAFFTACGSSDCVKFIEKLYRADSFSVKENGELIFAMDETGYYEKSYAQFYYRNEDVKKTMYYKDDTADSWTKEEINFFEYSNSYSYAKDSLGIERDFCGYLKCLADEFDKATTEVDGKYIVRESYSVEGTMQLWMEKGMLFIEWNEDGGDHIITIYDVDKTKIDYPEELKNAATD